LWTIIGHRLKQNKRGVTTVITVVLSLVIIVVIVSNVVLWSYEMNQLDWEKIQEDLDITNVTTVTTRSSWFVAQSEYTVNTGSYVSGSYTDTHSADGAYETFTESASTSSLQEKLLPNAAGQYAEWGTVYPAGTPHWDANDDDPPDDDASYVQTSDTINWRKEAYNLQNSSGSGTINWIQVYARARRTSIVANNIRTLIRTYSSDYESSNIALTTSYQDVYTQYNTNPYTSQTWTWSEIDSLQAGATAKSIGVTHVRMTAVWVIVNYTLAQSRFDINGTFIVDLSTYPLANIQTIEMQLKYRASDSGENWYLKAYNWTSETYSDNGFNTTAGHTPTTNWDTYAVNLTDQWRSYVSDNGKMYVKLQDNQADATQTTIDIDFLGVRAVVNAIQFTFENNGALTANLVSLWIINSTLHQHYDIDIIVNSADTYSYTRTNIVVTSSSYTVKVVTARGNKAVYSVEA